MVEAGTIIGGTISLIILGVLIFILVKIGPCFKSSEKFGKCIGDLLWGTGAGLFDVSPKTVKEVAAGAAATGAVVGAGVAGSKIASKLPIGKKITTTPKTTTKETAEETTEETAEVVTEGAEETAEGAGEAVAEEAVAEGAGAAVAEGAGLAVAEGAGAAAAEGAGLAVAGAAGTAASAVALPAVVAVGASRAIQGALKYCPCDHPNRKTVTGLDICYIGTCSDEANIKGWKGHPSEWKEESAGVCYRCSSTHPYYRAGLCYRYKYFHAGKDNTGVIPEKKKRSTKPVQGGKKPKCSTNSPLAHYYIESPQLFSVKN
jgi:histone H3/H4